KSVVNAEKRKSVVTSLVVSKNILEFLSRFSSYEKLLRVTAWIIGFCNCKNKNIAPSTNMLSAQELKEAEIKVLFIVQKSSFSSSNDEKLRNIPYMVDKNGLLRMKTRLTFRENTEDFKFSVILTLDHPVVTSIIVYKHKELMHCGIQTLIACLREKYWILKVRRTVRKVIRHGGSV
ncbi:integrase_H2C2 domain-containing protein, partial [Nephila pilipes]